MDSIVVESGLDRVQIADSLMKFRVQPSIQITYERKNVGSFNNLVTNGTFSKMN